jgi:hypothetical protein
MRILLKFFSWADTPIQRLGALGLAASCLIMSWTALDWQLTEGFYRRIVQQVEMPRPDGVYEGHRWERDSTAPFAWRMLDEKCLARQEQFQPKATEPPNARDQQQRLRICTRKELPGYARAVIYRPNWRDYVEALTIIGPYRQVYGTQAFVAGALFGLAFFAYFGLFDRLFTWIRTGRL